MQTTINRPVSCYGIGVHSGKKAQLTLKPAPAGTGIVFIRTDVPSDMNVVIPSYSNVHNTMMSTNIKNQFNVEIGTIEHLMAALWGCGIDNAIAEIDGPEVPIMDGSSKAFVFMIECVGKKSQRSDKKYLKLLKEFKVEDNGAEIIAIPNKDLTVNFTIDFNSKAIGTQKLVYTQHKDFINNIAEARTFGFLHEVEYLKNQGLARGASLDNAVAIDNDVIINPEGLRYQDEFVRHKILDQVGDFYTSGANFVGELHSYKAGHNLNNKFLRKLLEDHTAYEFVSSKEIKKAS